MTPSFVLFRYITFLYCNSVHIVVGTEGNDFLVRCNVVDNASANSVDVKVIGVHECHAAEQEDSSADFAQ